MWLDALVNQMLGDRPAWHDDAACHGIPLATFFPTDPRQSAKAIKLLTPICGACPVREQCLEYALSFGDKQLTGIWAGTTEKERTRRRHYREIAHGTRNGYLHELRLGLDTCDLCREAHKAYTKPYKMHHSATAVV